MDRPFVVTSLCYAVLGLVLGIYMSATHNHAQLVTHAHIMLLGFVVTFIYGLCHKLWLNPRGKWLTRLQFYTHQLGSAALFIGLFMLYGGFVAPAKIEPVLGIASVLVLLALVMMCLLFVLTQASQREQI